MSQPKDKMSEIDEHIMKRFDIQKRLGKGAYGIVWKAVDRKTKEIVAVKKIFDAFRNQTDAQRTFREIMFLLAFKRHPNIIRLHSIHRAANNKDIYLGFEYMETDLHNVIKRGNILKDIHKRYIMYQLLKATKYIHSGNVIHRDQKPSNVLLDSLCRCKIADFGLARSLTQPLDGITNDTDPTLTDYVATRWYRAPEILIANRRYTKGIDMWSLGCILGEMLAGKPIFPGSSTVNQVEKIMAVIPAPSHEDINSVCVSGIGSSMIKNAVTLQRIPLRDIVGSEGPEDALDMLNKLLVFNPVKRLTAEKALEHHYVSRFHDPRDEPIMHMNVTVPLNDDIRLSIDDYRNKLYELMESHHSRTAINKKPTTITSNHTIIPDVRPAVTRETERYLKSHCKPKENPRITKSEPRFQNRAKMASTTICFKSDSKLQKNRTPLVHQAPTSEPKIFSTHRDSAKKSTLSASEIPTTEKYNRKTVLNSKSGVYQSFNSYNASHGIITQSALMELRAAGLR